MAFRTPFGLKARSQRTSASSAYWANRLKEHKQGGEAAPEEFIDVRERLDEQSAQLDALADTLRRETIARTQLQDAFDDALKSAAPQGGSAGIDEDAELRLRAGLERALQGLRGQLAEELERQMAEVAELGETIKRETASREQGEASIRQAQTKLVDRLGRQMAEAAAAASATNGHDVQSKGAELRHLIQEQAAELASLRELLAGEAAARERSEAGFRKTQRELSEQLREQTVRATESAALAARADTRDRGDTKIRQRVELQAAELRTLADALAQETAARECADLGRDAEAQERAGRQAAELRALADALKQETAARERADLGRDAEIRKRTERQAAELHSLADALKQEATTRERADLGRDAEIRERAERQAAELQSLADALERERAARERGEAAARKGQTELAERLSRQAVRAAVTVPAPVRDEGAADKDNGVRQFVEQQAVQLRGLSEALEREVTARGASAAAFEAFRTEVQRQLQEGRTGIAETAAHVAKHAQVERDIRMVCTEMERRLESHGTSLEAINDRVERNTSEYDRLDVALQQLKAAVAERLTAHDTGLKSVQDAQAGLTKQAKTHDAGLKSLQEGQASLTKQVSAHEAGLQSVQDAQAGLTKQAKTHDAGLKSLRDGQAGLTKQVAAHEAGLKSVQDAQAGLKKQVSQRDAGLKSVQDGQATLTKQVATHEAGLESLQEAHAELTKELAARDVRLASVQDRQVGLTKQVATHDAGLQSVQEAQAELTREMAAHDAGLVSLQHAQMGLTEQAGAHATKLESLRADLAQAARVGKGAATRVDELRKRTGEELGEQKNAMKVLRTALEREGAARKESEATLMALRDEAQRQFAEHADALRTMRAGLQRADGERRSAETALQEAQVELEQRLSASAAQVQSLDAAIARERGRHRTVERAVEEGERSRQELNQQLGEHAAALRSIDGLLKREIAERRALVAAVRRMEEVQAELGRTMDARIGDLAAAKVSERLAGERQERGIDPGSNIAVVGASSLESSIGQEITVPVNGILGMTGLALDTDLTDAQREYMERVKAFAEEVISVMGGGASWATGGEAGAQQEPVAFKLREHLRDTLRPLLVRANQAGLELTCHIAPRVPNAVVGHAAYLRLVLINLVENGIKFTQHGEVSVCVDVASQTAGETVLLMTVTDSGGGMPIGQQEAVLDELARGRAWSGDEPLPGGLGLPVSAQIIRRMGGRIWLESDPDQGTAVRFTVRLGLQEENDARPFWAVRRDPTPEHRHDRATRSPGEQPLVLIAEASPHDRASLKTMLENRGCTAITVEDGRGVLAALENDPFDLVLMDLRMPGMDAFEATAAIRTLEASSGGYTPIVALVGDAADGDQSRCNAVGIDAVLTKPVQGPKLIATIEALLCRGAEHAQSVLPPGR
jgi:signal transduction histidine kinase